MASAEALVVALNGREVRRLTDPSYLGNPLNLDVTQLLTTAGLDPAHPPASLLLTLTRDGDACGGYWGAHPSPLLTVDLAGSRQIAFVCDASGSPSGGSLRDICVINPDGTGRTNLTNDGGTDYYTPAWSPDRTRIAYTKVGASGFSDTIWVMNADGTGRRALITSGGTLVYMHPEWSPDGTRIAYSHPNGVGVPSSIAIVAADGSGSPTELTHPSCDAWDMPSWSPDGTRIAAVQFSCSGVPPAHITVMNVDGTNLVPLTGGYDTDPAWSPDGGRIAYQHSGNFEIFVVNADGTGQTALGPGLYPTWSPSGTQIAFVDVDGIRVMNADGTGRTWLAAGDFPAW